MTPETTAVDQMKLRGNIIPPEWFLWLKFPNGKTDGLACLILSEVVYWYRGAEVLKEGVPVPGIRSRKFHSDILQKSYDDLSGRFGITKRQATDAVVRLENAAVIARVFRNIKVKGGHLNNVLYLRIFPERLREITFTIPEKYREASHVTTGDTHPAVERGMVSRSNVGPSHGRTGDIYKEHITKSTDKEEKPKSFASEGLLSSSASSAPADLPVDDVPPAPPEDESPTTSIPASQSPGFPKLPGGSEGDYIKAVELFDYPASVKFIALFPGFAWDQNRARQYLRKRRKGGLTDDGLKLLARYFHEATDVSDTSTWRKPRDAKALLTGLDATLSVCRGYARLMLRMEQDELDSVVVGDIERTGSFYKRAKDWVRSHKKSDDPRPILEGAPVSAQWAARAVYALEGIYPAWTTSDRAKVDEELADDPQILSVLDLLPKPLDPTLVFGLSLVEIEALNIARIAERQAVVDAIRQLL